MLAQAQEAANKILAKAGKMPAQVFVRIKKGALIRFTNNGVHQNGFQDLFSYTLRILTKRGPVWVESNDFSCRHSEPAGDRRRISRSFVGRRRRPPQDDGIKIKEHFPFPLRKIPQMAAQAIEEAVRLIRQKQASANGYYSAYERFFYLADSSGQEVFHPATAVRFGVTVTKGSGKGYFSFYHPDAGRLRVESVVEKALELADLASRTEVSVKPGVYECIFSPRAFLELIEPLRRHFDSSLTKDGKSVFSGLLKKKIFSDVFTLSDNVNHPGQFGVPFDAEGTPRPKVELIKKGILHGLLAEGHSTRGLLEHPFYPENLVVEKGAFSLADLFKRIQKGIFINKIWYHTLVRESRMEVTGLATAGSLFIENGKVRGRVVNLRYHDSLFSILGSLAAASREQLLLKDGERGAALFPYLRVLRLRVV